MGKYVSPCHELAGALSASMSILWVSCDISDLQAAPKGDRQTSPWHSVEYRGTYN